MPVFLAKNFTFLSNSAGIVLSFAHKTHSISYLPCGQEQACGLTSVFLVSLTYSTEFIPQEDLVSRRKVSLQGGCGDVRMS